MKGSTLQAIGKFLQFDGIYIILKLQVFTKHQDLKNLRLILETHSEPSQTSEMERFEKIVHSFKTDPK